LKTRRVIVDRGTSSGGLARQPAAKAIVEKASDAPKILVIGDFLADGLNWGMQQAYSENPNVLFIDKSSGLSGLVRDDVFDWPGEIAGLIDETDPVAVIVAIGMNDRQMMRLPGQRVDKLSDPWKKEYEARIDRLITAIRERNLPLIWLGLPPVGSSRMNKDYLVFNEIFRTRVEAAGGEFVDVWDGFTNAEGAFISAGPDINGQIVRLRNSDGINMTNAGKRKLAFYIEKPLRKFTGIGSDSASPELISTVNPALIAAPEYDPAKSGKTVVISLDDPFADGATELDGGEGYAKAGSDKSATSFNLVANGVTFEPRAGRIDADWGLPEEVSKPEPPAAGIATSRTNYPQ
jgi:hypothetical protein